MRILNLVNVEKQADVEQKDQRPQPQTAINAAPGGVAQVRVAASEHGQQRKAHRNIERGVQQATQGPMASGFLALHGDGFQGGGIGTAVIEQGVADDDHHHDDQKRGHRADQIHDAVQIQAQGGGNHHRHGHSPHHGRQAQMLLEQRARARQHGHPHPKQKKDQGQIDQQAQLFAKNSLQHFFVRIHLELGADAGNLHAQKRKQHAGDDRASDTHPAKVGEKLQYLLAGGKAAANDDAHVGRSDLKNFPIHGISLLCKQCGV